MGTRKQIDMTIATLITSMKDEAPYILEWVAYHRSIGFDRIVVMANDCTDGTREILMHLNKKGFVSYYENIVPLGAKPHSLALKSANQVPEVKSADFAMVLDADEFLVVKEVPHTIKSLISVMERQNASMMVIPWRIFGSSHLDALDGRPVIERFTKSMDIDGLPNVGVKTLFRRNDGLRLAIHFPKPIFQKGKIVSPSDSYLWIDPDGNPVDSRKLTWNGGKNVIRRNRAEIAHFMIKSLDEYILKIFRGDGLMNSSRHGIDYWRSADRNQATDLMVAESAPMFWHEYENLISDPELKILHERSIEVRKGRIAKLLQNDKTARLKQILSSSTKGGLTEAQVQESRDIVAALSPPKLPQGTLVGDAHRAVLLSLTTAGLAETSSIVNAFSKICRTHAANLWQEREFSRHPVTFLLAAAKHAEESKGECQINVRYFDNFSRSKPNKDWPLAEEIIVLITRKRDAVLAGFPVYVARSKAKWLAKPQRGFPPVRSVLSGKESLNDVEALIRSGQLEDPVERTRRFLEQNDGVVVLNLDEPESIKAALAGVEKRGSSGKVVARLLRAAIALTVEDTEPLTPRGALRENTKSKVSPFRLPPTASFTAAKGRELRMFWFRRGNGTAPGNFGDELGPLLVERLTGFRTVWAPPETCDLAGIGSILSQVSKHASRVRRKSDLLIWGSGLMEDDIHRLAPCLQPLSVRGALTRTALGLPDMLPLGDPGIFASDFVASAPCRYRWGIVPHFSHRNTGAILSAARTGGCLLIDPTKPAEDVLVAISSCAGIISSSLHGLIVADSYNIPSVWLNLSSHKSHEFKFRDYCTGVGRNLFRMIEIEELESFVARDPQGPDFVFADGIKEQLYQVLIEALGLQA